MTAHNFINYQQAGIHHPPLNARDSRLSQVELQDKIPSSSEAYLPERHDFDGIAIFEAPTQQALQAAFADPYWTDVIVMDVGKFADQKNVLFENGIVAQYTGRLTTPIANCQGLVKLERGREFGMSIMRRLRKGRLSRSCRAHEATMLWSIVHQL
jgi:hypothetical protein